MPHGDINLGQYGLREWFVTWRHQAITWSWTNDDLLSVWPSGNNLGAISQEIHLPSISANELNFIQTTIEPDSVAQDQTLRWIFTWTKLTYRTGIYDQSRLARIKQR